MPVTGDHARRRPLPQYLPALRLSRYELLVALACTAAILLLRLPSLQAKLSVARPAAKQPTTDAPTRSP